VTRFAVTTFLIAHGLIHIAIYASPSNPAKPAPFDPSRSWALAAAHVDTTMMRSASLVMCLAAAAAYAAAGWLLAFDAAAWTATAAIAAVVALALKGLWFNRWLSLGVALDISVLVAAAVGWPASV
jgi:hypothetical protein